MNATVDDVIRRVEQDVACEAHDREKAYADLLLRLHDGDSVEYAYDVLHLTKRTMADLQRDLRLYAERRKLIEVRGQLTELRKAAAAANKQHEKAKQHRDEVMKKAEDEYQAARKKSLRAGGAVDSAQRRIEKLDHLHPSWWVEERESLFAELENLGDDLARPHYLNREPHDRAEVIKARLAELGELSKSFPDEAWPVPPRPFEDLSGDPSTQDLLAESGADQ